MSENDTRLLMVGGPGMRTAYYIEGVEVSAEEYAKHATERAEAAEQRASEAEGLLREVGKTLSAASSCWGREVFDVGVGQHVANEALKIEAHLAAAPVPELRVDSVGTCSRCGYEGPGPAHDCKPAPVPPEPEALREARKLLQMVWDDQCTCGCTCGCPDDKSDVYISRWLTRYGGTEGALDYERSPEEQAAFDAESEQVRSELRGTAGGGADGPQTKGVHICASPEKCWFCRCAAGSDTEGSDG
jgi:hypothetical protein